ncbi:MAG: shikimate dehydrogenase [Proteobacteria bacterium]|nr:shikimate dehydrogenase [Pseudomonadota bacterium]
MTIRLDSSIDNYCVMGNPVAHSKSPQIHAAFAEQTRQKIFYQAILVDEGKFKDSIKEFQRQGGKGLNITVPFKPDAWEASDQMSRRAERAVAVNTISFNDEGKIAGDNTDGIGLIRDLTINHKLSIKDKNILILGAGGAARGILDPLFDEQADRVVIANRTVNRAEKLVDIFSDRGDISTCGFDELVSSNFDIVINATSASLQGDVPPLPEGLVNKNTCCYDMMYSAADTPFVAWAKAHGAGIALDGLGMLVEQAAESFFIWRGVRPETGLVIDLVRRGG